ncbi:MAG TPA: nucleotidyltransferase domain-containing protein [Kiritimatiellia bacterium]|nr:nucleotidyltransferase domain-containing protein [Kiritimatiellia bacterium]
MKPEQNISMIDQQDIVSFARDVARKFDPERIVLFGSYAEGKPDENSDVDILVVMNHSGKSSEQALAIRREVRRRFPLDLIVRSPQETKRRQEQGDGFISSIVKEGRTLYERAP